VKQVGRTEAVDASGTEDSRHFREVLHRVLDVFQHVVGTAGVKRLVGKRHASAREDERMRQPAVVFHIWVDIQPGHSTDSAEHFR
jgi:hypothetical protein